MKFLLSRPLAKKGLSAHPVVVACLGAPVASDRNCDPVAATEAEAATEAATEPPRARDRKIAEACDRACDRQRPKKRGQQLLRPGVFSHLVETKRLRPNCDRCDRDRDRATGATKVAWRIRLSSPDAAPTCRVNLSCPLVVANVVQTMMSPSCVPYVCRARRSLPFVTSECHPRCSPPPVAAM